MQFRRKKKANPNPSHPPLAIATNPVSGEAYFLELVGMGGRSERVPIRVPVDPAGKPGAISARTKFYDLEPGTYQTVELSKGVDAASAQRVGDIPLLNEIIVENKGDVAAITEFSVEDLKVVEFNDDDEYEPEICPSCEKRPILDGDYLCRECRFGY